MFRTVKNLLAVAGAAIFPILFIYSHNPGYLQFGDVYLSGLLLIVFFILVWLITWLIVKDQDRAMLTTFFSTLYFFSYDFITVKSRIFQADVREFILTASFFVFLLIYIFVFYFPTVWLKKIKSVVFIMLIFLMVTNFWWIAAANFNIGRIEQTSIAAAPLDIVKCRETTVKPDIYYLVLDAYAREDILKKYYDIDNSGFTAFLKDSGFYVADKSYANYPRTLLSLSSTLNLDYHIKFNSRPLDNSLLIQQLRDSQIMSFLQACGYETYSFATGFPGTEMTTSDHYLSPKYNLNYFHYSLISLTPLQLLLTKGIFYSVFDAQRQRIKFSFANLPELAGHDQGAPRFVVSHITAPHEPFVFDSLGQPVNNQLTFEAMYIITSEKIASTYRKYYADQLKFITNMTSQTINNLQKNIDRPAIIIVQSDHGPASSYEFDLDKLTPSYLYERFSILNAYYFFDGNYTSFYDSISPVNSFRLVLNQYLGQDLPRLEDKLIYTNDLSGYIDIDKEKFIHLVE